MTPIPCRDSRRARRGLASAALAAALAGSFLGQAAPADARVERPAVVAPLDKLGLGRRPPVVGHAPVRNDGWIEFSASAPIADSVSVVGTWNRWDPAADPMARGDEAGPWRAVVPLSPGAYQFKYRYHVPGDDRWRPWPKPDPEEHEIFDESEALFLVVTDDGDAYLQEFDYPYESGGFDLYGDYDRVDALLLGLRWSRTPRGLNPRLMLAGEYAFGLETGGYHARVEQPIGKRHGFAVGAEVFRRTAHFDEDRITRGENVVAAAVFSEDFRDYVRDTGWGAEVTRRFLPYLELGVDYAAHDFDAVAAQTDWSLFGQEKEFRPNDLFGPADEGTLRSVTARCAWDTRRDFRRGDYATRHFPAKEASRGWAATGSIESAGEDLGGDFDFTSSRVDVRRYDALSRRVDLDLRAAGGLANGEPPAERRFYLGGIGTLRGRRFKSFEGTRYALVNAEGRMTIYRGVAAALFCDAGDTWSRDGDAKLHADLGVGIGSQTGALRVDAARPIESSAGDAVRVTVRAARTF